MIAFATEYKQLVARKDLCFYLAKSTKSASDELPAEGKKVVWLCTALRTSSRRVVRPPISSFIPRLHGERSRLFEANASLRLRLLRNP